MRLACRGERGAGRPERGGAAAAEEGEVEAGPGEEEAGAETGDGITATVSFMRSSATGLFSNRPYRSKNTSIISSSFVVREGGAGRGRPRLPGLAGCGATPPAAPPPLGHTAAHLLGREEPS